MAISGEKILYVGSEKKTREKIEQYVNKLKDEADGQDQVILEEIDLNGKFVVPGFIDSHMHPILAIYFKTQLSVSSIKSYAELSKLIEEKAKKKGEEEWICCLDFMEERLSNPQEQHFPDRRDLDKIWSKNPLIVLRHDAHICGANSLALSKIQINKSTLDQFNPESGEIKTLDNGEPSGIFTERATTIPLDKLPIPNMENFKEACADFSHEYASYGITTIGGMLQTDETGISGSMGAMEVPLMQTFIKEGTLEQDYVFYLDVKKPKKLLRFAKGFNRLDANNGKFQVGGIKIFV
ncbi:MAG: amidohydrolase family protein, partial [Promethearchaeota archaeon]